MYLSKFSLKGQMAVTGGAQAIGLACNSAAKAGGRFAVVLDFESPSRPAPLGNQ